MLQENLKKKKSTSAIGQADGIQALYSKPYHNKLYEEMQNKTQPLPKNLIHSSDMKPRQQPYGLEDTSHNQKHDTAWRPKVGNHRQVEIVHPPLPGDAYVPDVPELQVHTILTEVTSEGGEEPSNLSTQRSPDKVNEDYEFGRLLGEGAYAVVRVAVKKSTGETFAAKIYDKSKLVDEHRRQSVCREVMLMQKLSHNFIVDFCEAFETDAFVFVIMEHV